MAFISLKDWRARSAALAQAAARAKAALRPALALTEADALSVNEIACADPGCPDTETIVLVMRVGEPTRALRFRGPLDDLDAVAAQALAEEEACLRAVLEPLSSFRLGRHGSRPEANPFCSGPSADMSIKLRPLEREDLLFVHQLNNNDSIMRYWFEEAYESFAELAQLYERNIHNQTERRFIIATERGEPAGMVELVEINHLHRRCEFQIAIHPDHQGKGYAKRATRIAIDYAFKVLNIHKLYLHVDKDNKRAAGIYESCGFRPEGILRDEFFVNGRYRDAVRMCLFQPHYLAERGAGDVAEPVLKT